MKLTEQVRQVYRTRQYPRKREGGNRVSLGYLMIRRSRDVPARGPGLSRQELTFDVSDGRLLCPGR